MTVAARTARASQHRRLWPRFTLRVLLVAITAACIGLAIWTHRAREQRRVALQIERAGGMVCYERDGPFATEPRNFAVEWLAGSLGRDYFEGITAASIHDRESAREVHRLYGLIQLQIFCNEINDEDVQVLAGCRKIEVLNLGVEADTHLNKVTDQSLSALANLPRLRVIHLRAIAISEAGIRTLASSPTLEVLDIGSCDASVDASDFDVVKCQDRIKSLLVWRRAKNGSEEIIARW